MISAYARQVYAGILGKVIGVYMGRPIEGWRPQQIADRFGLVDRYVAPEADCPLIVADDDISGTLTFIRALEDSGRLDQTPDDFFGDTWLNYLLENQTILWWGGMGVSTEHTAYLRLKAGIRSPESGSAALNGQVVAQQIGAQIFIDCFGMVAPGNPALAAELAGKAAGVSHDGEAVYAAQVVASMVAAAFSCKSMKAVLDQAVACIPKESLIAQVHHDVRAWCKRDKDWQRTLKRIEERYGYQLYGGGCHVIPNHAIMVMAWSYAPDDFRLAQTIVNSAGYDTDCNAANVGAVMGILLGLDKICQDYDFRSPMADRILLPTADGTNSATDCWNEARRIARLGEQLQHLGSPQAPTVWMDFAAPGAVHGFMLDAPHPKATIANPDGTGLLIRASKLKDSPLRASTPLLPLSSPQTGYATPGTSKLYPGMLVSVAVQAEKGLTVTPFLTYDSPEGVQSLQGTPARGGGTAMVTVPDTAGYPVLTLGLEITADTNAARQVKITSVNGGGNFSFQLPYPPLTAKGVTGWITQADHITPGTAPDGSALCRLISNQAPALAITGNRWWHDTTLQASLTVHLAEEAGLVVDYQGTQRYVSLTRRQNRLVLALQHYGETILASRELDWPYDQPKILTLQTVGSNVVAYLDGMPALKAEKLPFSNGACGFICRQGNLGLGSFRITGTATPCL